MGKRSNRRDSTRIVEVIVEKNDKQSYNYIRIQSLLDAQLEYEGKVSGRQYRWSRAGDVVEVLQDDVPELLAKRVGVRSCCGEGGLGNLVFQQME